MNDKDDFRFPDEEGSPASGGDESGAAAGGDPEEWQDEKKLRKALKKAEQKKGGSSTRILLLVLMVVVIAGAALYFSMGVPQPEPPPPPPQVVKKQPIAVPPAPPKPEPAEPEQPPEEKPAAEPAPAAGETAEAERVVEETPAEPIDPEPLSREQAAVEQETARADAAPERKPAGDYVVHAGAFMFKANLADAMNKLVRMGFEPRVQEGIKEVVMTRLRLGAFPPEEAEVRMQELSALVPGVFSMQRDGRVVVYAGSFYNLDRARLLADRLYRQGIRLEEETVELEVPIYQLSFGGYADPETARAAAEKVQETGLDTNVVKKG